MKDLARGTQGSETGAETEACNALMKLNAAAVLQALEHVETGVSSRKPLRKSLISARVILHATRQINTGG
jgi:hypothetical protein